MKKINSNCKFGDTLDFDKILENTDSYQLSQSKLSSKHKVGHSLYHLHAILCHSGTLNSGHYFCYIKESSSSESGNPFDDGRWVKYNDQNVNRVFKHLAFATGQGGYNTTYSFDWESDSEEDSDFDEKEKAKNA